MTQQATIRNQQAIKKIMEEFPNNMTPLTMKQVITPAFVHWLCNQVQPILEAEPNVIDVTSCVHIVGDIHGQFDDLITIFKLGGIPPKQKYIFLGDYVDRGKHSLEVICLLLILKYLYPEQIILLRGNHESREMIRSYGFENDCKTKLTLQCKKYFCTTFDKMPLCAIVDKKAFCVHGGISKDLNSIKDISEISRFCEVPEKGLFCDLLWSDPSRNCKEWEKSDRCETNLWGIESAHRFLEDNNLSIIIRGHQVVSEGYKYAFSPDKSVVTLFSAPNYSKNSKNKATFMTINEGMPYKFTEIHPSSNNSSKTSPRRSPSPKSKVNNYLATKKLA